MIALFSFTGALFQRPNTQTCLRVMTAETGVVVKRSVECFIAIQGLCVNLTDPVGQEKKVLHLYVHNQRLITHVSMCFSFLAFESNLALNTDDTVC